MNDGILRTCGGDDDIHVQQMARKVLKGNSTSVIEAGEFFRMGESAVGHDDFIDAVLQEVRGREFGHFAGADEHGLVSLHGAENTFGEFNSSETDGHG